MIYIYSQLKWATGPFDSATFFDHLIYRSILFILLYACEIRRLGQQCYFSTTQKHMCSRILISRPRFFQIFYNSDQLNFLSPVKYSNFTPIFRANLFFPTWFEKSSFHCMLKLGSFKKEHRCVPSLKKTSRKVHRVVAFVSYH